MCLCCFVLNVCTQYCKLMYCCEAEMAKNNGQLQLYSGKKTKIINTAGKSVLKSVNSQSLVAKCCKMMKI